MTDIHEEKEFITFYEAIEVINGIGVPIGKTALYQMIRGGGDLPVKFAFGRYIFDRKKLIEWVKNVLKN